EELRWCVACEVGKRQVLDAFPLRLSVMTSSLQQVGQSAAGSTPEVYKSFLTGFGLLTQECNDLCIMRIGRCIEIMKGGIVIQTDHEGNLLRDMRRHVISRRLKDYSGSVLPAIDQGVGQGPAGLGKTTLTHR